MATLSTVTTRVLTLLGSDAKLSTSEAESLVQTRYEHIYENWLWPRRLKDFVISLVAQVSSSTTDTVTATLASSTITSAGTPFTAAMAGRQIQIGAEPQYFFVNSVTDSANIVLGDGEGTAVTWPRATASGLSWRIFKTIYTLPSTAQAVVSLAGDFPLEELDGGRKRLDDTEPERLTTNDHPTSWVYAGADSSNVREIEVWPVPSTARLLRGQFLREAPTLASGTTIDIPVPLLVFAAAADACHMLHTKQGSTETMWENKALFFERKALEVMKDYRITELELTSPPTQLGRWPSSSTAGLRGTDWEVTHDLDTPY